MEQWKRINNYPDYEISNYGRIKSYKYKEPRIMNLNCYGRDYPYVQLTNGNGKGRKNVAKLVAEHFLPNPYNFKLLSTKDGNKHNIKVDNLVLGSETESLTLWGFGKTKTGSRLKIMRSCNVRELFDTMMSDMKLRDKKTWFYGVDLYGNVPSKKYEHNISEELLDKIWESWYDFYERNN